MEHNDAIEAQLRKILASQTFNKADLPVITET
jgi:hypothetical protein